MARQILQPDHVDELRADFARFDDEQFGEEERAGYVELARRLSGGPA